MKFVRLLQSAALAASVSTAAAQPNIIPGRYIVMLNPGNDPAAVAASHGVTPDHLYDVAVVGFAGAIPAGRLRALERDPRVLIVEPDRVVSIIGNVVVGGAGGSATVSSTGDLVPTGVQRIRADLNPRTDVSSVGVAIIDTGICLTHPDLNVAGGVSYVRGVSSANDDYGHGSHVAGIAAAKINGVGIRGVAPNARLYAVKVLDSTGSGTLSAVVSGINWVTKNTKAKNIKVANMSLGFQGTSTTLDSAIQKSVNAGVTYVVAAGNSATDASTFSPANNPNVITVSAIADSDGQCGGAGISTGYGMDDSFASFSNYGSTVELAAPGVNIYSTYLNNGYATMSGTSMAAPHVTGAVALYLAGHSASPSAVRSTLISLATPQAPASCVQDTTGYRGGFNGDPDTYHEPLVDAAGL
jgi:subtilisin